MALARVLCPDLIGRETELSILEDALLATLRGDGRVVILGGEAGMGKTRLVNELAAQAQRLNCVVMSGACSEAELSLPYLPFLEALGNHLATEDLPALRDRLGPAADELAHLFPQMGRPGASGDDATQAKLRLFESKAQSPAGEVTLSEEAHRRVRAWLEERRIAPERLELLLKGFDAPVVAYRVVAHAATPSGS